MTYLWSPMEAEDWARLESGEVQIDVVAVPRRLNGWYVCRARSGRQGFGRTPKTALEAMELAP